MRYSRVVIYETGAITADAVEGLRNIGYVVLEKRLGREVQIIPEVTLRDQFAMAALGGILAGRDGIVDATVAGHLAYELADAMLAAREPKAENADKE